MNKYILYTALFLVILLSSVLRFYKLGTVAPGISWDEASVGYNAYTIAHWGRDEWGRMLPITFKSFEDYKNPVHVYLTVPFVGLFGLNELATRFPAALFGVANVIMIFLISSLIFKSKLAGLIGAFILAVSPYNIQFSRFNHELNFAIFFFSLGFYFFLRGKENRKYIIPSFVCFGIDLLTYQSAKVVTPPLVFLLTVLFLTGYKKYRKELLMGVGIYSLFIALLFLKPELLGGARLKQNVMSESEITQTAVYKKTSNKYLSMASVVLDRYKGYFEKKFLFETGDPIPRHSAQIVGTFYKMDQAFLTIGLVFLLYGILFKKERLYLWLLVWCLIAPLPGAASSTFAHAARAMFITMSWHLVITLGVYKAATLLRFKTTKALIIIVFVALTLLGLNKYVRYYYGEFATRYGTEWQYGMRDIVSYVAENPQFYSVYMTDAHSQPYIFFLYYLKTPLPEFLSTVEYNNTKSRPSNLVTGFGRYKFGMWDQIESYPNPEILYIVNPSKYDGLRFKDKFCVMKKIVYPDNTDAFFIVSGLL